MNFTTMQPVLPKLKTCNRSNCNNGLALLIILTMSLLPIYIFPSGGLQVVDIFILILGIIAFIIFCSKNLILHNDIHWLLPFIVWSIIIEIAYFIPSGDNGCLKVIFQNVYSIYLLYVFSIIFTEIIVSEKLHYLYFGLFLSLLPPFFISGVHSNKLEGRMSLSFNDPNQLGYFAIILLCLLILLHNFSKNCNNHKINKIYSIIRIIVFIIANCFIFISLSRSAGASALILDSYILYCYCKENGIIWVLVFLSMILIVIIFNYEAIFKIINNKMITYRYETDTIMTNIDTRIFNKIVFDKDWQILVGCSHGIMPWSFNDNEIHNIFIMYFRSYGIIGLLLFIIWIIRLIFHTTSNLKGCFIIWSALLFYNSFVVGTRFRPFWILMGLMIIMAKIMQLNKSALKKKYLFIN